MKKIYPTTRILLFKAFLKLFFLHAIFEFFILFVLFHQRPRFFVLLLTCLMFLFLIFFSFWSIHTFCFQFSAPLKQLVETLRDYQKKDQALPFLDMNTLELFILQSELAALYDQTQSVQENIRQKLIKKNVLLQTLLSTLPDVILILDQNRKVLQISPLLLKWIALDLKSVLDHPWSDLPSSSPHYLHLRSILTTDLQATEIHFFIHDQEYHYHLHMQPIPLDHAKDTSESLGCLYIMQPKTMQSAQQSTPSIPIIFQNTPLIQKLKYWIEIIKTTRTAQTPIELTFSTTLLPDFCIPVDENKICWVITTFIMHTLFIAKSAMRIDVKVTCHEKFLDISITHAPLHPEDIPQNTIVDLETKEQMAHHPKTIFEIRFHIAQQIIAAHHGILQYFYIHQNAAAIKIHLPLVQPHFTQDLKKQDTVF